MPPIDGTNGDDFIPGTSGPDIINALDGNDVVNAGDGDDVVDGGTGNDTLRGQGGNDHLIGGDGNDTLVGGFTTGFGPQPGDGADHLEGGIGNDVLRGGDGDDVLEGGDDDDNLRGDAGSDTIDGGAGDDFVSYFFIAHGTGLSFDARSFGSTTTFFVNDPLGGVDTVSNVERIGIGGTEFDDTIRGSNHFISNQLSGLGGNDFITGGVIGDDFIDGGAGDDNLRGEGGNDTLFGGDGSDFFRGGAGVDSFDGGSEDPLSNTFGAGSFGDRISFFEQAATQGVIANLMTGIISNDGFGNVETMTGIESLGGDTAFADTFDGNDVRNLILASKGDTVRTWDGDDIVQLGGAAALLDGGLGTDTLNLVTLGSLLPDNNGDGLAELGPAMTAGWFVNLQTSLFADGFGDGGTVNGIENVNGTEFGDTIFGDGADNVIDGGADGDSLRGNGGNDTLIGGDGNDLLRGGGGVDTFDGGANTLLSFDGNEPGAFGDRVSFSEIGATQGVVADLRTGIISNDGFGNAETMTGIESLGADTAYADTLHGNDNPNFIWGALGDSLYGHGGDDFMQASGAASIVDGGTGIDTLTVVTNGYLLPDADSDGFAETGPAMTAGWTVNLLAGTVLDGFGNTGTIAGVENIVGTEFDDTLTGDNAANQLEGGGGTDVLSGGAGSDTLLGGDGDDYLIPSFGNNILDGGAGLDRAFFYIQASSPPLSLAYGVGVDAGKILVLQNGTTRVAEVVQSGSSHIVTGVGSFAFLGTNTLTNIERIAFSPAPPPGELTPATGYAVLVLGTGAGESLAGNVGHDLVQAGGGNDILDGLGGNDLLDGGDGDDTADGGADNDTIRGEGGADHLIGGSGNDTLIGAFGTGFGPQPGDGSDHLEGGIGNDTLRGGDGDDWLEGGDDFDNLRGDAGSDTIDGGAGDDFVSFVFSALGAGITFDARTFGSTPTFTVADPLGGTDTVANVELLGVSGTNFDDVIRGSLHFTNASDFFANQLNGGGGNDLITGGDVADLLDGGAGNDTLRGNGGKDRLFGGDGNDTLVGGFNTSFGPQPGDDSDELFGGAGNDVLRGGDGDDVLQGGDDNDNLRGDAGSDTMDGGAGRDFVSYVYTPLGSGITLDARGFGATTTFTITDQFGGTDTISNVESIGLGGTEFDDVIWGSLHFGDDGGTANQMAGFGGNDILHGADQNDFLSGDDGNDTLDAGGGDDGLVGGAGDDDLDGGTGSDTAYFYLDFFQTGTLSVVAGTGPDAGKQLVLLTDGATVTRVAEISVSGAIVTVTGVNGGAVFGTDTVTNVQHLVFVGDPGDPTGPAALSIDVAAVTGVVSDGYLAGATVFIDENGNGLLDPGEISTVTDAEGNFTLPELGAGELVAFGGISTDTGLANELVMTAPNGATVVNPLTTLIQAIVEQDGVDAATAQAQLLDALGLDPDLDLLGTDLIAAAGDGDADALAAQQAAAIVVTILTAAEDAAGDAPGAEAAAVDQLAALIASGDVDLTDSTVIEEVLEAAAPGAGDLGAIADQVADTAADIAAAETLDEIADAQGDAMLTGNDLDNILTGGSQDDELFGAGGNDRLTGGDGVDRMTGGSGADTFVGEINATEVPSKEGPISLDLILDFQRGSDKIDLSGIDANASLAGDQAFRFVNNASGNRAGDLWVKTFGNMNAAEKSLGIEIDGVDGKSPFDGKVTVVFGNVDGGAPDFALVLIGGPTITASDFIL